MQLFSFRTKSCLDLLQLDIITSTDKKSRFPAIWNRFKCNSRCKKIAASRLVRMHLNRPCLTNWPLRYYTFCTKMISLLKKISVMLAKSNGQTLLVKYITSEQYLNVSPKKNRINGTVWFPTCVAKKWLFCTRCEKNWHFGRYLSWYGVVNSNEMHLGDVALILLYLLNFSHVYVLNISVSINVVRWVFKSGIIHAPHPTRK